MWQSSNLHFAANHPTAAGHFPSNPIIPGALLLDELVAAIAGNANTLRIRTAKFLHPVRPGETLTLKWQPLPNGAIKFECHLPNQAASAMSGTLEITPTPP